MMKSSELPRTFSPKETSALKVQSGLVSLYFPSIALFSKSSLNYSDEGNPDTVSRLIEKLIAEDQADFLLAPYSSGLTKSASAIAEKYDKIMVSGGPVSDSLFTRGFKNLFSVLTPASQYTE